LIAATCAPATGLCEGSKTVPCISAAQSIAGVDNNESDDANSVATIKINGV
jgi:hypothetical protein